jgi:hypothetical protein
VSLGVNWAVQILVADFFGDKVNSPLVCKVLSCVAQNDKATPTWLRDHVTVARILMAQHCPHPSSAIDGSAQHRWRSLTKSSTRSLIAFLFRCKAVIMILFCMGVRRGA